MNHGSTRMNTDKDLSVAARRCHSEHRGAVSEGSRGLSVATPPVSRPQISCTLKGCENGSHGERFWHPSGMQPVLRIVPGVSRGALNPRLPSCNSPGWLTTGGGEK
jgi:hypothetical protein